MASHAESILAPLRAAASRAGLMEFLRWWWGELAAMVPAAWRERISSRGTAYLAFEGDEWRILRPAPGALVEDGRVNLGSLDVAGRRGVFRRLLADASGGAGNVWLVLPRSAVLVRPVVLPLAAEEAIYDAVGFELDRLTPFAQDHAMFDCRVTLRETSAQRLTIELAAIARASVEARIAELREVGATVLGVGIAEDISTAPAPFNLLAPQARDRPATSHAAVAARLMAGLAAVLALAALVYPLWQKREAVISLQPRLDRTKASADVADRLSKEIEKLASEHNFLLSKKQGQHPTTVLLEDLSRLLPDTTWVSQLDIKSGAKIRELQISGETGSSSQLIEVLEKSGSLVNASFKSPLTKGVTPNTERFLLAAEVKPRALPEPMPEEGLVSSAGMGAAAPAPLAPAIAPPVGAGTTVQGQPTTPPESSSRVQAPGTPGPSIAVPAPPVAAAPAEATAKPKPGATSAAPVSSPVTGRQNPEPAKPAPKSPP